jgi:N6-L-threonylcarbamoyladenine synthase
MRVDGVGRYQLLGDTLDDAAGEAFDKTAKLLGLGYPGGPALAGLADQSQVQSQSADRLFKLPRPLLNSGDLNFSFSGLKTAVLSLVNKHQPLNTATKAELAWEFQEAITDVLSAKCMAALRETGLDNLVVSGGVGANLRLRQKLNAAVRAKLCKVSYPRLEFCTDNGAMIAFAGAMRLQAANVNGGYGFSVKPRWDLAELLAP